MRAMPREDLQGALRSPVPYEDGELEQIKAKLKPLLQQLA